MIIIIDTNKQKEEMSIAYLNAICAFEGISLTRNPHDSDGIDCTLSKEFLLDKNMKFLAKIDVQLKSTSEQHKEFEMHFTYPLKKKNYDDLRREATVKSFLFLFILPKKKNEWLHQTIDELIIKECMFHLDLMDFPSSENTSRVTIEIPKNNIVSPKNLNGILYERVKEAHYGI
ncbi:MAG: DUF4365 domain-containing protein [Defluviitaleaceae bacterium]|nr:DUF4365 domain-containing protein [Defluviitaleaceae bacterium]